MKNMKHLRGMTLVEIMIVIAILGLLVSLGVPGYLRSRNKARQDTCINNLRMIENASDQYRIDWNLTTATTTDIVLLWPASLNVKSVASYINKQLECPDQGDYVGGDDDAVTPAGTGQQGLNATPTQTTITANGVPHCYDGSKITNNNTEFSHRVD